MRDTPTIHVDRDQNHLAWDPAIPPVATVSSGDVVAFDCLDASNGQLTAGSTVADLAALDFDRVDQVTGPVEVDGAEPGDTLQVDVLDFAPADWGWTASIPGFGLLADDFPDPALCKDDGRPGHDRPGRVRPGDPDAARAVLRRDRAWRRPTGPHSTIPPRPASAATWTSATWPPASTLFLPVVVPERLLLGRRQPCHPGRRRGLRHRDRERRCSARCRLDRSQGCSTSRVPRSSPRPARTPSISTARRYERPTASAPT